MTSPDLTVANIDNLAKLFPGVITETIDADGNPKQAIDFDLLRQELSDHIVEGSQERYRLDWPGKRAAAFAANAPIAKTLRPVREESFDFDTTKNLFIEGDNLDALKLLQESYLGKVKLIYIDPPYNTNSDLVYHDYFAEDSRAYLARSGQTDDVGNRLTAKTEGGGRYHSDWLSMIFPRLKLARNLLSDDGALLVSINDIEAANLRVIGNEVFGHGNFVTQFIWLNHGHVDQSSKIKGLHEYVVAFARKEEFFPKPEVIDPNIEESSKIFRDRIENSIVKNGTKNPPSTVTLPAGFPASFEEGVLPARMPAPLEILDVAEIRNYKLLTPTRVRSGWSSRNLLELFIKNGCTYIEDSEGRKTWFELTATGAIIGVKERSSRQGYVTSILRNLGTTEVSSNTLRNIGIEFSYPKPVPLIQFLVAAFTSPASADCVMDLFAGSGTTAEAVMRLNRDDGGLRPFILVQYPEPIKDDSATTIADLCRSRIEKVGQELKPAGDIRFDSGFRSFHIDSTNMADVWRSPDETEQIALHDLQGSVKHDRSGEDLLFQVLLDWGLELSMSITVEQVDGHEVFVVEDGALIACFDIEVGPEVVRAIAKREPLRAVFRDSGFVSDDARINAEQIFRELSPTTDVKAI